MKKDMKFLFQGDSITDGNWGRNHDPNHILGHGYVYHIAGELSNRYAALMPKFYNRGVSGNTAYDLHTRWQEDTLAIAPDVLSILCGINDNGAFFAKSGDYYDDTIIAESSPERFEYHYRAMLEEARERNPDLVILLGLPFRFQVNIWDERFHTTGDEAERTFIRKIQDSVNRSAADPHEVDAILAERCRIIRKIAVDFNAAIVDYPALFEEALQEAPVYYWIWDGVHPTYAMHWRMAKEWLKVWDSLPVSRPE